MKVKVYLASKFSHGEKWKELKRQWNEIEFTSRWFQIYYGEVPNSAEFAKLGWLHDLQDVARADVLMLYGGDHNDDRLCGGLVEAGVALAKGKPVLLVGDNPDFGTWQYHPLVHKVGSLEAARQWLELAATSLDLQKCP